VGQPGGGFANCKANPHGAVLAGGRRVGVAAQPATDAASVARVSELLRDKYLKRWPGPTESMLREATLPTTLRLRPEGDAVRP